MELARQSLFFKNSLSQGRLTVTLEAYRLGNDLLILVYGGTVHIGALSLAQPDGLVSVIIASGHREGSIAQELAVYLARTLKSKIALGCGLHFDAIQRDEIDWLLASARKLCQIFATSYTMGTSMEFDINDLTRIQDYLASGKLEAEFRDMGEFEKGRILEFLEKLMDLGELSDEVATRLIYRGLMPIKREEN